MTGNIKLVIFDLDGTLVDSALDFDLMREEMGLPKGMPILEELEKISDELEKKRLMDIVLKHELRGAHAAVTFPGVEESLNVLRDYRIKTAILTRNAKTPVEITLAKMSHDFDFVITRDHDVPAKPAPDGLFEICRQLTIPIENSIYVGDYKFDLDAAKAAGMRSVLYAPGPKDFESDATFVIRTFHELLHIISK